MVAKWPNEGSSNKNQELPKESTQAQLDALQKQLEQAEKQEDRIRIRSEILAIKRSYNRTKQFNEISGSKLAEWKNNLDNISATNLMKIDKEVSKEKRWEFLSKSFLYKRTEGEDGNIYEEATDWKNLKEGDTVFVDFWNNKSANRRIGLWHMLSADIGYVSVDGKIWIRSIVNWRVGYYTSATSTGYIPVFTGSIVRIPTQNEVLEFENKKDQDLKRNDSQEESDNANDKYINRVENTHIESIEINTNTNESYNFWIASGFTHNQASGLLANEYAESSFNPRAVWDWWKAHGIFQWHPDRREVILKNTGIDISTASHIDQLKAALWEMRDGPEKRAYQAIKWTDNANEVAALFCDLFERPADREGEMTKRWRMAEAFSILLDKSGRSTNLWDHVVKKWPANTWDDSCWAAVRELLESYWIKDLPQYGANGKEWERILNERPNQFVKMRINHPDEAYPWAILIYDGSGIKWSEMNKKFGHVEIKWSDWNYYSFYKSEMSAWSAKTTEKDPQQYADQTGFIGYAYYPKQS